MKRKFLIAAIFCSTIAVAQHKAIKHTIQSGETIGALAAKYGVSIQAILQANNLTDKTILRIGQIITIPSASTKTTDKKEAQKIEKNQHQIVTGESLSRIANKYNVSEKDLKEWNNLSNDKIKAGDVIYISNPHKTAKADNKPKEEKKVETVKKEIAKPIEEPKKEIVKKEVVKPIETPKPVEVKEEPKPAVVVEKPVATTPKETEPTTTAANEDFEKLYENTNNSIEGNCSTFKTISGWHDKKYYILLNNAENGSVVKVSANGKYVYAKVLGALPNIKNDNNIVMRISNAAAAALGISANHFTAKVEF